MVHTEPTTVVVLGMHRSGTSLVAGILDRLGIPMGPPGAPSAWVGKHWSNPTGHFENQEFCRLDDRILGRPHASMRWQGNWDAATDGRLRQEAAELLGRHDAAADRWGWKNPWTVLTLDAYAPSLRSPRFVFVNRRREEIVRSIARRDGTDPKQAEGIAVRFEERMDAIASKYRSVPSLRVSYERLMSAPRGELARLRDFAGAPGSIDEAAALICGPATIRALSRRQAVRDVAGFPGYVGWLMRRGVREAPGQMGRDLGSVAPRELGAALRAAVAP